MRAAGAGREQFMRRHAPRRRAYNLPNFRKRLRVVVNVARDRHAAKRRPDDSFRLAEKEMIATRDKLFP